MSRTIPTVAAERHSLGRRDLETRINSTKFRRSFSFRGFRMRFPIPSWILLSAASPRNRSSRAATVKHTAGNVSVCDKPATNRSRPSIFRARPPTVVATRLFVAYHRTFREYFHDTDNSGGGTRAETRAFADKELFARSMNDRANVALKFDMRSMRVDPSDSRISIYR